MTKLTYDEFKRLLMSPSVSDEEIAQYLTVDRESSGAFDPRVVPDRSKIKLGPEGRFDVENALRWANGINRWRRHQRFEARINGSRLPVLVSEGDSWFQFPFLIKDVVDQLDESYLIWSLDAAGDTAENMVNRRPEYIKALTAQRRNNVQAFLFSAAGNDVIGEDEFGEPVLKALVKPHEVGRDAAWHVDQANLARILGFLETAYRKVIATIRADPTFETLPIVIHGYDYALPGGQDGDPRRPSWAAQDKWLGAALRAKNIVDRGLQASIVRLLIDALYDMLAKIAAGSETTRIYLVDVRGALPQVTDWADEIHATDRGFNSVAVRFRAKLIEAGVGAH